MKVKVNDNYELKKAIKEEAFSHLNQAPGLHGDAMNHCCRLRNELPETPFENRFS